MNLLTIQEIVMKKKILLDLHPEEETNYLLLDSQDAFKFIDENNKEDVKLFYYLEKWCQYLNYYLINTVTCNGNIDAAQLKAWISGYNFAKDIIEQEFDNCYILTMKKYEITIKKPLSLIEK